MGGASAARPRPGLRRKSGASPSRCPADSVSHPSQKPRPRHRLGAACGSPMRRRDATTHKSTPSLTLSHGCVRTVIAARWMLCTLALTPSLPTHAPQHLPRRINSPPGQRTSHSQLLARSLACLLPPTLPASSLSAAVVASMAACTVAFSASVAIISAGAGAALYRAPPRGGEKCGSRTSTVCECFAYACAHTTHIGTCGCWVKPDKAQGFADSTVTAVQKVAPTQRRMPHGSPAHRIRILQEHP